MFNIKKCSRPFLIGLICVSIVSCKKDFLDNTDKTRLTDETQWASEGNADIFLNDIYGSLCNKWNDPENLDNFTDDNDAGFYWPSWSWRQGIVGPSVEEGMPMDNRGFDPNATTYASWDAVYTKVRRCNLFIQKVTEHADNFSPAWLHQRLDEARFLRAFFYSNLWMHLGGIPLITEVPDRETGDSSKIYYKRSSFELTVSFLTSQLDSIVNNGYLAVKYHYGEANAGRATLGAALMLKGWIQLYAASPAFNDATPAVGANPDGVAGYGNYNPQRWADAAATFRQFMDNYGGQYGLFPDIADLWLQDNEYHQEVIWDRQVVPDITEVSSSPFGTYNMASAFGTYGGPVYVNGAYYTWGNYDPTQELVDQFCMANGKLITDPTSGYNPQNPYEGREQRFYDFIVYDGAPYKMDWMETEDTIYTRIDKVNPSDNQIDFGSDDVGNTGYYFKKRLDPTVVPGGYESGQNYIYYRYAEVLLGYAEAQNEAAGPDASVYNAVNKIRARSGLPDLPAGLNKDQMRTAIHRERRVEFCFEDKRLYDLIRWKDAMNLLNKDRHGMMITNSSPNDNSGTWVYAPVPLNHPHVFTQKMYLNPIPQSVIDQNPLIIQNPGY